MAGLSVKRKRTPSRASSASMREPSIIGAVSVNSWSEVNAGARSLSASKVSRRRRKFCLVPATYSRSREPPQSKTNVPRD